MGVLIPLGILESVPDGNDDASLCKGLLGKGLEIYNLLEMFEFY